MTMIFVTHSAIQYTTYIHDKHNSLIIVILLQKKIYIYSRNGARKAIIKSDGLSPSIITC